jgi:hypothetical protein
VAGGFADEQPLPIVCNSTQKRFELVKTRKIGIMQGGLVRENMLEFA